MTPTRVLRQVVRHVLRQVLRNATIAAAAALLVTGFGASTVNAQTSGAAPTNVDGTPAKKPVSKKTATKPSAEKPQKPSQSGGSSAIQGYRPDPISSY